jgi:hypothetical protein
MTTQKTVSSTAEAIASALDEVCAKASWKLKRADRAALSRIIRGTVAGRIETAASGRLSWENSPLFSEVTITLVY